MALEDESRQLAVVKGLGDARLDVRSADERHGGDDQAPTALVFLEPDGAAMHDAPPPGGQVISNAFLADDGAA